MSPFKLPLSGVVVDCIRFVDIKKRLQLRIKASNFVFINVADRYLGEESENLVLAGINQAFYWRKTTFAIERMQCLGTLLCPGNHRIKIVPDFLHMMNQVSVKMRHITGHKKACLIIDSHQRRKNPT